MEKKKYKKPPMTSTCVRIKASTLEKVEKIAEQEERSVSETMRLIIEKYVNNRDLETSF